MEYRKLYRKKFDRIVMFIDLELILELRALADKLEFPDESGKGTGKKSGQPQRTQEIQYVPLISVPASPNSSSTSIILLHVRQTSFVNFLEARILRKPVEHTLIDDPRTLKVSRNEEVSIARPRTQHKWTVCLIGLH